MEKVDARGGLISQPRLIDELQSLYLDTTYSIEGVIEFFNKLFDGEVSVGQDELKVIYMINHKWLVYKFLR